MTQPDCIFCRIATGEVASELLYEDDEVVAFRDINPRAPVHILVIPRQHLATMAEAEEGHAGLLGRLVLAANRLAQEQGLSQRGYRLVINNGPDSGQVVPHLHLHLLGGRQLRAMG